MKHARPDGRLSCERDLCGDGRDASTAAARMTAAVLID
jgi:hypothetical protein